MEPARATVTTLDYAPPTGGRGRRALVVVAGVLVVAFAGHLTLIAPVRRTARSIDAVTGSTRVQTTWLRLFSTAARTAASPLETRLRALGVGWTPAWRHATSNDYNLFGQAISAGSGPAPAILGFHDARVQTRYLASATNDEVRELARVMQRGTPDQQRAAIERATAQVFGPTAR